MVSSTSYHTRTYYLDSHGITLYKCLYPNTHDITQRPYITPHEERPNQFPLHSRLNSEDMPVRVGLGTRGSVPNTGISWSFVVGPMRLLSTLRLHSLTDCLKGLLMGPFTDAATNKERNAEMETTVIAMLDSCCCQNASQTISTSPFVSLKAEILIMATTIITIERHKEMPSANFCRTSTRTSHRRIMGKDRTIMSVITSIAVAAAVSRMTLELPAGP